MTRPVGVVHGRCGAVGSRGAVGAQGPGVASEPGRIRTGTRTRIHTGTPIRTGTRTRDAGTAALEYLGMLPLLLLVALAAIQLGVAAYCGEQAGTAARTAARTAAQHAPHADPVQAGRDAVSSWVGPDVTVTDGDAGAVTATATVRIPSVLPGLHLLDPVTRSATMPKEDSTP